MAGLSGKDTQRLVDALLSAFPSQGSLRQMVSFGLDENLDAIVGGGSLRDVAFELVKWAGAHGRVSDLLTAARTNNPGNPLLAEVARELSSVAAPAAQAMASPDPAPSVTAARRAVVLTALGLEFRAVRDQLTDHREDTSPTGTVYEIGRLASAGGDWEVAVVETGAGNLAASLETQRAIDHFEPRAVLFVGVAGGLKDVGLGDVVAGTKVYGYESGKDAPGGFRPRPELGMGGFALVQRARAEARKTDWRSRLSGDAPPREPEVFIGPIAAGEKVLANASSELVTFLRANYGDTLAVEMEGYGVMLAAQQRGTDALVVRGISDLIDGKEGTDRAGWQPRAARHAAAFAAQVLAKL